MGKHSKDRRDIYYRAAKEWGYRARSAFKLLQIDDAFHVITGGDVRRIIDLCAAPGGWTEVAAVQLPRTTATIIAVDIASMQPLPGVHILRGDVTHSSTVDSLLSLLKGEKADVLLCDASPDVIHQFDVDEFVQHQLLLSALNLCTRALTEGGAFIGKVFRGAQVHRILRLCCRLFDDVKVVKPRACRNSSFEAFVVCRGYTTQHNSECGSIEAVYTQYSIDEEEEEEEGSEDGVRFVSCGDALDFDADQTYPLSFSLPSSVAGAASPVPYTPRTPSALPIDPPYATALKLQRQQPGHASATTPGTQPE